MKPSRGIGIIDTPSNHPVDETVEKLKGILQAKGVTLFALLGAASITGVPAFGLPKISSLVGGIFSPAFSASPLWSTRELSTWRNLICYTAKTPFCDGSLRRSLLRSSKRSN